MSDQVKQVASSSIPPPAMFDYPSDAPARLVPLQSRSEITRLHDYWTADEPEGTTSRSPGVSRLVRKGRALALRALGRADHDFLADLTRSVDVVVARCDELAEQLARQQDLVDLLVRTLGEEVTRLRAVVEHPSASDPE
jgi:hypothetical protein